MEFWLLNTVPDWGVFVFGVAGLVALSLFGFHVWRKSRLRSPSTGNDTMVSNFASRAYTLFGILLVFVIVTLYSSFNDANDAVQTEATDLVQVVRDVRELPASVQQPALTKLGDYVREVRGPEWTLMKHGSSSRQAAATLDSVYRTLAQYAPETDPQKEFYSDALTNLDNVVTARRMRLEHVRGSVPGVLWVGLLFGAGISIVSTYPFSAGADRVQFMLVGFSAGLIAVGLVVAWVLNYPFAGSTSISNAPFAGALGTIGGG